MTKRPTAFNRRCIAPPHRAESARRGPRPDDCVAPSSKMSPIFSVVAPCRPTPSCRGTARGGPGFGRLAGLGARRAFGHGPQRAHPRHQRHPRQPRGLRGGAHRRRAGGTIELLVLGDLVGYGADPNAVIDRVRALGPLRSSAATTTRWAAGVESVEGFNHLARYAIRVDRRRAHAREPALAGRAAAGSGRSSTMLVEICHGTPFDEDAYVFDDLDALRALHARSARSASSATRTCRSAYALAGDQFTLTTMDERRPLVIPFARGCKHLVNPGSVGQPRDGDPRAGFGIVDTDRMEIAIYRTSIRSRKRSSDSGGGPARGPRAAPRPGSVRRPNFSRSFAELLGVSLFALLPLIPSLQLGRVRVHGGAAAEDPAEDNPDQDADGDVDEVRGVHVASSGGSSRARRCRSRPCASV